jgi:flavin reductase (DIM6/NTAB) family NADH-FMN oxidoreductase RutF
MSDLLTAPSHLQPLGRLPMMPEQIVTDVRSDALHLLTSGLYILTTCAEDTLHGATVVWVTQASSEPLLVLVALRRNSHLAQAVRKAHRFALNILAADQGALAERFFRHWTAPAVSTDLQGFAYRPASGHCPLLTDAMAWLECRTAAEPESPGDHALFLSEVTGAGVRRQGQPMVLWDTTWSYGGKTG